MTTLPQRIPGLALWTELQTTPADELVNVDLLTLTPVSSSR